MDEFVDCVFYIAKQCNLILSHYLIMDSACYLFSRPIQVSISPKMHRCLQVSTMGTHHQQAINYIFWNLNYEPLPAFPSNKHEWAAVCSEIKLSGFMISCICKKALYSLGDFCSLISLSLSSTSVQLTNLCLGECLKCR